VLARRITTLKSLLCASPDFIGRHGAPASVAALPNYSCLALLGSDEHDRVWTFVGQRSASIRIDGSFVSNSALALRKAAVAGLGIALLPEEYIAAELASGTLPRILPQHEVRRPVTALYARSPHIPQKVRLLVWFLVQWFKNERARSYA
jgi:DNA-binding transcriptional LysR family regulator